MKWPGYILLLCLLSAPLFAAEPALLPQQFSGWNKAESSVLADPSAADQPNAELLKEYGFQRMERAVYAREGRKLTVKAVAFEDATGSYGAFVYYRQPEMHAINLGAQGASGGDHVLFYRSNLLVDAVFEKVTAMSAAEMRALAEELPALDGPAANPPTLPGYLPKQTLVASSARFVVGPQGLARIGAPLSADAVDFSRGAEVALGQYKTDAGTATMMILSYPTPQIAAERERHIQALHGNDGTPWFTRRSGPLVALMTGAISEREAGALLDSVNYDADVTWSERTGLEPRENVGSFIIAAFGLVAIIAGFMIVAGIAFGGVRLVVKKVFPNRIFDRPEEVEIIRLNLRDEGEGRSRRAFIRPK
jgi:hypothetical protein